jgi:FkbM family methyltransferase
MPDLLQYLNSISPEPYDCVVHVGAGCDAAAQHYAVLQPKHLVLIEADPDAYAALAERFKESSDVTVIQALVGATAADITFHRYTLPSLNAPLGMGRLGEIYPRIEETEAVPLQARLLHEMVGEIQLGVRNLLVLDIPGQEAAIFRTLPPEVLDRFGNLIAITAAQAWQEDTESAQTTLNTLKESHFELVRESGDDPAWPQFLLQHDSAKAALKKELEHRARLLVTKATQIHQQTEQIAALTTERDALAARVSSLESENSDLATRHTSLATESEALRSDHSSLVAERAALSVQVETLKAKNANLSSERNDLSGRLAAREAEHSRLVTDHSQLATALKELRGQHSSLDTKLSTLAAEHSELVTRHSSLVTSYEAVLAERDDLATRHQSLVTALEELQGHHSSLSTHHSSLVTENEALHSDLAAKTTLLDVLSKGRVTQDEHMEKLLQEQTTLISERDVLASRVAALTAQIETLEARAKLIDEEFGKAEGQIELIKDIFLREALR